MNQAQLTALATALHGLIAAGCADEAFSIITPVALKFRYGGLWNDPVLYGFDPQEIAGSVGAFKETVRSEACRRAGGRPRSEWGETDERDLERLCTGREIAIVLTALTVDMALAHLAHAHLDENSMAARAAEAQDESELMCIDNAVAILLDFDYRGDVVKGAALLEDLRLYYADVNHPENLARSLVEISNSTGVPLRSGVIQGYREYEDRHYTEMTDEGPEPEVEREPYTPDDVENGIPFADGPFMLEGEPVSADERRVFHA